MAEDRKNTDREFHAFFKGRPFADMMRKMVEAKKAGHGSNCAEMMSQMVQMCCKVRDEK